MTNEQKAVVDSKLKLGYTKLGVVASILNGLPAYLLTKGRLTVVINSLGFDEHYIGKTWRLNAD